MTATSTGSRVVLRSGVVAVALLVAMAVAPAAAPQGTVPGGETIESFTELPIDDTENPCGSAVGSADGFGIIATKTKNDGSFRVITRYAGEFDVALTGDPIPNVWDDAATSLTGVLFLRTVEDSTGETKIRLRVWGETDTGVAARINQLIVFGPTGGHTVWNCFDGTGRHRVDF